MPVRSLPSILGVHPTAIFRPVVVRGVLVYSVENAPADWSEKLVSLGFKKGTHAWMRMGPIAPSEYDFICPSIHLKALRSEDVISLREEIRPPRLPFAVRSALIDLWQNNLDGILFELNLIYPTSKAQAWSHVESCLEGDETDTSMLLLGLAFARLKNLRVLDGEALEFAVAMRWTGSSVLSPLSRGPVVANSGDPISWTAGDGAHISGTVASVYHENDEAVWVFAGGPSFVGGISAMVPGRVLKHAIDVASLGALRNQDLAYRRLSANRNRTAEPKLPEPFELASIGADVEREILHQLRHGDQPFPGLGWEQQVTRHLERDPALRPLLPVVIGELEGIARSLEAMAHLYYGDLGLGFCLTGSERVADGNGTINFQFGYLDSRGGISALYEVPPIPVYAGGVLDFAELAQTADASLSKLTKRVRDVSAQLGNLAGFATAVPLRFLQSFEVSTILNDVRHKGVIQAADPESIRSLIAAAGGVAGLLGGYRSPGTGEWFPVLAASAQDGDDELIAPIELWLYSETASVVDWDRFTTHLDVNDADPVGTAVIEFGTAVASLHDCEETSGRLERGLGGLTIFSSGQLDGVQISSPLDCASSMAAYIRRVQSADAASYEPEQLSAALLQLERYQSLKPNGGRGFGVTASHDQDSTAKCAYRRESIWPRMSVHEYHSRGATQEVALALDRIWRALPRRPLSESEQDCAAFAELITRIRDGAHCILSSHLSDSRARLCPTEQTIDSTVQCLWKSVLLQPAIRIAYGERYAMYTERHEALLGVALPWLCESTTSASPAAGDDGAFAISGLGTSTIRSAAASYGLPNIEDTTARPIFENIARDPLPRSASLMIGAQLPSADTMAFCENELKRLWQITFANHSESTDAAITAFGEAVERVLDLRECYLSPSAQDLWSICERHLLSADERASLAQSLGPGSSTDCLRKGLRSEGVNSLVTELALQKPSGMRATAFGLWVSNTFKYAALDSSLFIRVRDFCEALCQIEDLCGRTVVRKSCRTFVSVASPVDLCEHGSKQASAKHSAMKIG